MRSKLFRSLFVVNLDQFLSLSVGFRKNLPLPPPSSIATNLRSKTIELLEKWNAFFGIHYKQLRLGFDYLKDTLRYQFPNRLENAARLEQERRERHLRTMQILLNKFEYLKENFSSIKFDIQSTVEEVEECLEIANVKEGNTLDFPVNDDEFEELNSLALRQIRLESLKEGDKVQENSENKAIFDVLREAHKLLISKHMPSVQEWISILVRVDATDNKFRDAALKEFIDLRNLIQSLKTKCTDLGIALNPSITQKEDEDLWEEGKIEAFKPEDFLTKPSTKESRDTASSSSESKSTVGSSVTDREKLLADAPVLAWSPFLLDNHSTQRDVLANQSGLEVEGHWGRVDPDAVIPAEKIAELNVRYTVYKEQPVEIPPCHAPLKKGGLCQRRDLRVCPFHGPVIPRDNDGNPIRLGLQTGATDTRLPSEEDSKPTRKEPSAEQADLKDSLFPGKEVMEKLAKQALKNMHERDREGKAMKRAKLAKVRKHNEEVLRDAAMASTSYSETFAEPAVEALRDHGAGAKVKKTTLASMLKKKVTAKDRIAEKLLSSRATEASSRQLKMGEDSKYREAFPNQW
ncbi:UV-stimulated scaffold protein A homolog isoform X2 [Phalaenopsis equestris]|nr:UV-stimulated scaffold protein A homolog isoform X2 [Phalaenopsis equestris]